jgi:hypothetical protein
LLHALRGGPGLRAELQSHVPGVCHLVAGTWWPLSRRTPCARPVRPSLGSRPARTHGHGRCPRAAVAVLPERRSRHRSAPGTVPASPSTSSASAESVTKSGPVSRTATGRCPFCGPPSSWATFTLTRSQRRGRSRASSAIAMTPRRPVESGVCTSMKIDPNRAWPVLPLPSTAAGADADRGGDAHDLRDAQ